MNQIINEGKSTVTANYLSNIDCQLMQQTLIVPHLILELVCAPQTGCRTLDHSHRALIPTEATQTNLPLLSNKQGENAHHLLVQRKKDISLPDGGLVGKLWQAFISDQLFWMFIVSYYLSKNSLQHVKTRCDLFTDTFGEIPSKRTKSQT